MDIETTKDKINKIENRIGTMVDQKLKFTEASMEQIVVVAIINDCIDLIKDIQRNIYAFELSYKNNNNTVSFNPNYYFESIVLQDDMIWERLILLVGIIDQLDVSIIFKRKSIEYLYDLIKKNRTNSDDLIVNLRNIKGDYNSKRIKFKRNNNEHFISTHLDAQQIDVDIKDLIYVRNGQIKTNMDVCSHITNRANEVSMDELKKWIPSIKKRQDVYIQLIEKIITELHDKNVKCNFNCAELFIGENPICERNFVNEAALLEDKYKKLREDYRNVIYKINEFCIDIGDEASTIRNTLLIDGIFRAKEMIRSINLYLCCLNYDMHGRIMFSFPEEDFLKFINNDVITADCYYFHAVMKTYSVCEKIAKFILCKYDFDHKYTAIEDFKNTYIEDVIEKTNRMCISSKIIELFKKIMEGQVYSRYEKNRNLEYHCLRQEYLDVRRSYYIKLGKVYEVFVLLCKLYELFEILVNEEREILCERIQRRTEGELKK